MSLGKVKVGCVTEMERQEFLDKLPPKKATPGDAAGAKAMALAKVKLEICLSPKVK